MVLEDGNLRIIMELHQQVFLLAQRWMQIILPVRQVSIRIQTTSGWLSEERQRQHSLQG
jgi:hypothetical protein